MPEPIEYQIIRNLQSALRQITKAGGYYDDVAALAVKLDPNQDAEALIDPNGPRPFVILEVKEDRWEYIEKPNGIRLRLPVTIHWVSDSLPTIDESRVQTFFRGCADVERAIAVDIGRGGLAVDTRILGRTYETAIDGSQVWALIETEIVLHRIYGAPNG